jgi:hypothetical protein
MQVVIVMFKICFNNALKIGTLSEAEPCYDDRQGQHIADRPTGRRVMRKLTMAAVATIVLGGLPIAAAVAGDAQGTHHRFRHHARAYGPYLEYDPAIQDGYTMNGNFDWRRRGQKRPWYAHGYSDNCVAWEKHAYHYACDVNGRY